MDKSQSHYIKMTETPVAPLIVRLAVPTIITMLITNIYNLADTAFVGQLGNSASGAVGVVFGLMSIIQAIAFMFGHGSGSIMSRAQGAMDAEKASRFASAGFFWAFGVGVIMSVLCFVFMDPLLLLLGSTDTILPCARGYVKYIAAVIPFNIIGFVMNNQLRYEGKATLGMIGMLTGAVLNIIGDPILMFVCGMGIEGAGLSTALSQCISSAILLSMFLRGKTQCSYSIKLAFLSLRDLFEICTTGMPSLLRQGLASISTMLMNNAASVYGDGAVAAMSIIAKISMFMFCVSVGVGQGFQPVSAFNYGAGKFRRVREAYKITLILSTVVVCVISVPVYFNAEPLVRLFRDDPKVIENAALGLRLQCFSMFFMPLSMASEMQFQSTGQKLRASLLSAMRNGILYIPALLILSELRGMRGILEAQPLSNVLACIPALILITGFMRRMPREDRTQS